MGFGATYSNNGEHIRFFLHENNLRKERRFRLLDVSRLRPRLTPPGVATLTTTTAALHVSPESEPVDGWKGGRGRAAT